MEGRTDGQTEERTNERTDIRITIYPRNFVCGGYNDMVCHDSWFAFYVKILVEFVYDQNKRNYRIMKYVLLVNKVNMKTLSR